MSDSGRIDTGRIHRALPDRGTVGILVGGGPAPGINGVIAAITIEAINSGYRVLGFQDGYRWLCEGRTDKVTELTIDAVSRVHLRGGSLLGTSRANPKKDPAQMNNVLAAFKSLRVGLLASIGGDDTANTAREIAARSEGALRVAHVPKTIDNDLPLPPNVPTFGFHTARQEGMHVVRNLMEDAKTTGRWYLVVTMGRQAGHLALGIGKAAGATLVVIGEELTQGAPVGVLCDIIEGSILKRRAMGRSYGVAMVSEGVIEKLDPDSLEGVAEVEVDEHGHKRLRDIPVGMTLRDDIVSRFARRGDKVTMVAKDVGYELRCADPITFDLEYTRDLGYGAMRFLDDGGSGAMISIQGGRLVPIPFADILDPISGRTRVRLLDVHTEGYRVARKYMIRLEPEDFADQEMLARLARQARMTAEEFRERFGYLAKPGPHLVTVGCS